MLTLLFLATLTVVDPSTYVGNVYGSAPPNAVVTLWDGERAVRSATADGEGAFLINNVPAPFDGRDYTIECGGSRLAARVLPGAVMALEVTFPADGSPVARYRHEREAAVTSASVTAAPTSFTKSIFATREGLVGGTTANGHIIVVNDHFVALPSRRALSTNFGHEREVRLTYGSRNVTAPVWDVGPWNTHDDYWNPASIRETFKDLPRGLPESEAAFLSAYNGGKDERGRTVLNPAGIDLADGTFRDDLALPTNDRVTVEFLWLDEAGPITGRLTTTLTGIGFVIDAEVSDNGTGNSPIAGAEMFIDAVGADGSGTPMTALDGAFDSATEVARGTIDVLPPGIHVVYVHGRDAFGNWGPLRTAVLGAGNTVRRRTVRHG